jgi:predicted enzyme related to lactoylglutathione lyase
MSSPNNIHHQIDYIEFSVTDMNQAKSFYSQAFDWSFTDYAPSYCGIKRSEGEAGGLCLVDKVTTGGPLVILFSSDLESSRQKVIDAGGVIGKEIFDFPGGRRFEFLDPSGNLLAVWSLN